MFEPTILPMDVTACHAIIHRERANYLEYRSRVVSDREVYLQVVRDLEARLKEMQDRILALQFGHDLQLRVA